jgi:tyrosinase
VLDTTTAPLFYEYEDSPPPPTAPAAQFAVPPTRIVTTRPSQQIPEMLGATDAPVLLAAESATATLHLEAPSGPAAALAPTVAGVPGGAATPRIHLNLENVTGETGATNYDVYLDLPEGADPEQHPELLAGVLAPFGVARSSTRRDPHSGGSGLNAAFDITAVVSRLQASGSWDSSNVRVSFVPTIGDEEPTSLRVGRISVYVTP